jgi:hypothetical protein
MAFEMPNMAAREMGELRCFLAALGSPYMPRQRLYERDRPAAVSRIMSCSSAGSL